MNWLNLTSIDQAHNLIQQSNETPVLFFKHSTRCSIINMAKDRLERNWKMSNEKVIPVYLDLLNHRDISNFLAEHFKIEHQSPQVILVKNEKAIYNDSHSMINAASIENNI